MKPSGPPSPRDVESLLRPALDPPLSALGFVRARRGARWISRERDLAVRSVIDAKARDPYRGGAFTLEFEHSDDARFGRKLAGRARFGQLLTADERLRWVRVRNAMVRGWPSPPADHLRLIPAGLRETYLAAFAPVDDLPAADLWMRYRAPDDLTPWLDAIVGSLPDVVRRARRLDPHTLYLGRADVLDGR